MSQKNSEGTDAFADYLRSIVQLEALEKTTQILHEELADSQRVMMEIQTMFNSIAKAQNQPNNPVRNGAQNVNVSKFLETNMPNLLMPDMDQNSCEVDINKVVDNMRKYAEELKKNFALAQPQPRETPKFENLNLEQYAVSLDQLSKRLANVKLNKVEVNNRNSDLEAKLTQLCKDVNMFTQMVQAKTALKECHEKWTPTQKNQNALCYDNIINKLLADINEVTYLLQNKN